MSISNRLDWYEQELLDRIAALEVERDYWRDRFDDYLAADIKHGHELCGSILMAMLHPQKGDGNG